MNYSMEQLFLIGKQQGVRRVDLRSLNCQLASILGMA